MVDPPSDDHGTTCDLAGFTRDQAKVTTTVKMPRPVEIRLERLAQLLPGEMRELGDVTETELVAVLIDTAEADADDLAKRVAAYRYSRVHETIMSSKKTGSVTFPPRKRGRPKA